MNFASNTDLIIGNDKYEINLNTIDKFKSELDLSTVYLATGENFADALSGSILAGSNSNPLILVGNNISNVKKFFANNSGSISNIKILGGTGAVKEEAINELASSQKSTSASSSSTAPISDTSSTSIVTNIEFVSANLTKTGAKTAAFKYKVLDRNGADITKTVSFADINAYASVGLANAAIVLDPSTRTGTITYNFSDTDEQVTVSLLYKNGLVATSSLYFDSSKAQKASIVKNIEFPATNTKKIDSNSATFYYKISNEFGTDITKMIPGSEITATGSLDSSIELNPLLGTGTIKYKSSSDNGKPIAITLADKVSGVQTNVTMNADGNPKISKIEVTKYLTVVNDYGISTFFAYDQYGNDISGTSLAEEITFNSDIGKVEKSNNTNLIKLIPNPGVDFSKLTKVRITGIDPDTGISMSAELTISR